jgi:hypothetical protein
MSPRLLVPAFTFLAALSCSSVATAAPGTRYDLRAGSFIIDDCLPCGRPTIPRPIEGTFTLTPADFEGSGTPFALADVDFRDRDGAYTVTGTGFYVRDGGQQSLTLSIEVNGKGNIQLAGTSALAEEHWPAFTAEATEPGTRDPLQVFTVHIVAAPRVAMTPYVLEEGSLLVDGCNLCDRPDILVPIRGSFLLGEIEGPPNPFSIYRLDAIDFADASPDFDYRVTGLGTYRQGGEVALLQEIVLDVMINQRSLHAESGAVPVRAPFPRIDIEAREQDPQVGVTTLHLIATPGKLPGPTFRRGDTNADGAVDISDGVKVLVWLFAGAGEPSCLDAADTDDNEEHQITDAIYLLQYLFLAGMAPPAPGPDACGQAGTPSPGCASYPPCGG